MYHPKSPPDNDDFQVLPNDDKSMYASDVHAPFGRKIYNSATKYYLDFSLLYQIVPAASNVLYGYWSHDIGGHQGVDHIDPELYVRWMQFGAFSPILESVPIKGFT